MNLREEIITTKKKKDTKAKEETTPEYSFDRIYRINRMKTPGRDVPGALSSSMASVSSVAEKIIYHRDRKEAQRESADTQNQIQESDQVYSIISPRRVFYLSKSFL